MSFPTNTSPYGSRQNIPASPQGFNFRQALFGKPEQNYQQSLLGPEQQTNYQSLQRAGQGRGAGGAFGDAADYYRDQLSNEGSDFDAFAAPELRRFREDIIPDLSEQFAGMGHGSVGGSAFANAATRAGTDLSERLGRIRAQIRQQAAQGLQGIGQAGLGTFNENINRPETYGLLGSAAEGVGKGLGMAGGAYGIKKLGL